MADEEEKDEYSDDEDVQPGERWHTPGTAEGDRKDVEETLRRKVEKK